MNLPWKETWPDIPEDVAIDVMPTSNGEYVPKPPTPQQIQIMKLQDEQIEIHTRPRTSSAGAGMITIFQHNTRQAGTVHCSGEGPRATLETEHVAEQAVQKVSVDYAEAVLTAHPVIDVLVTGKGGRVLGHAAALGPMYYESGTVDVPMFTKVARGEVMRILIGLQVHAGCLPHPFVLGLPGSRFVEGARAMFPSVTVS